MTQQNHCESQKLSYLEVRTHIPSITISTHVALDNYIDWTICHLLSRRLKVFFVRKFLGTFWTRISSKKLTTTSSTSSWYQSQILMRKVISKWRGEVALPLVYLGYQHHQHELKNENSKSNIKSFSNNFCVTFFLLRYLFAW